MFDNGNTSIVKMMAMAMYFCVCGCKIVSGAADTRCLCGVTESECVLLDKRKWCAVPPEKLTRQDSAHCREKNVKAEG